MTTVHFLRTWQLRERMEILTSLSEKHWGTEQRFDSGLLSVAVLYRNQKVILSRILIASLPSRQHIAECPLRVGLMYALWTRYIFMHLQSM